MSELVIYPVQIRPDVVAKLHLPGNLTKEEAEKICRVVMALACQDYDRSRDM